MVASLRFERGREASARTASPRSPVRPPPVSPETISEDAALNCAFNRAVGNFRDEQMAVELAFAAVEEFCATWETKMNEQSQNEGGYKPKQNPASYLDTLITLWNQSHKDFLIKNRPRDISREDKWLWFTEDLLHLAKTKKSPHMPVAVLMILCDLPSHKIPQLYWYLNQTSEIRHDSTFRRSKLAFIDLMNPVYGPFTKVREIQKNEKRYDKESDIAAHLEMFKQWLQQLTPLHPQCLLTSDSLDPFELEHTCTNHNVSAYPDGKERNRKHIMQCPKCLTRFLRAVGWPDWTRSFAPPQMSGPDFDSGGNPSNRTKPRNLPEPMLALLKTRLHRSSMRRQKLSFASLFVAVDNGKPQNLRLKQRIHLQLKEGNSLIRVSGKDLQGRVPLDSHLISWDEDLAGQHVRFATILGNQRLEFSLQYDPDMTGAAMEVACVSNRAFNSEPTRVLAVPWIHLAKAGGLVAASFAILLLGTAIRSWSNRAKDLSSNSRVVGRDTSASAGSAVAVKISSANDGNFTDKQTARAGGHDNLASDTTKGRQKDSREKRYVQESRLRVSVPNGTFKKTETAKLQPPFDRNERHSDVGSIWSKIKRKARTVKAPVATITKPVLKTIDSAIATAPDSPVSDSLPSAAAGIQIAAVSESRIESPSQSIFAQETAPIIVVTDTNSRPVPFARLFFKAPRAKHDGRNVVAPGELGVITNSEGVFTVMCECRVPQRSLKSGTYDIVVSKEGFETTTKTSVLIGDGANHKIEITLDRVTETEPFNSSGQQFQRR